MKLRKYLLLFLSFSFLFAIACGETTQTRTDDVIDPPKKKDTKYNFRFTGWDTDISDPTLDRRSYYKIYIDKTEVGRTTIGLESQKKIFEAKLTKNRHLLTIEKWIANEKSGEYEKLNNISQPKPAFYYFDIKKDSDDVSVTMTVAKDNKAVFTYSD